MSFDLFFYCPPPPEDFFERWSIALKRRGVDAEPQHNPQWREEGVLLLCYAKSYYDPDEEGYDYPEDGEIIDISDEAEIDKSEWSNLTPAELTRMEACTFKGWFHLGESVDIKLQMQALPALMEALNGVLCDPQGILTSTLKTRGRDDAATRCGLFMNIADIEFWTGAYANLV